MSAKRRDLHAARSLYQSFREEPPRRTRQMQIDVPGVAAIIGTVEFVGYVTTHGGKTALYIHEFAPGSRPLMVAGKRRGQLFFVGGRFQVTSRGITDLNLSGRPIDATPRYEVRLKNVPRRSP